MYLGGQRRDLVPLPHGGRTVIALLLALAAQPFILGGDQGIYTPPFNSASPPAASLTIDAPAYTRTVTASSYTLTGTSTGSGAVTWAASPSGESGACTGTDSWSCVVTVTPDAVGEGVEVITVTRGAATDTETLGFYVAGAHTAFLSQNINGTYNSGLADLDAVATWENVGTSALDVTQATGSAKPTFRTGIVGGQPVVRCDGGDRLAATTASDWTFLNDSADWYSEILFSTATADPNALYVLASTATSLAMGVRGATIYYDDRAASSRNNVVGLYSSNGSLAIHDPISASDVFSASAFGLYGVLQDDDAAAGVDVYALVNGTTVQSKARTNAYSALAPTAALTLCAQASGTSPLTGDLFRVLIYQSALTATQRGINLAVDEWALGGTLPVTP